MAFYNFIVFRNIFNILFIIYGNFIIFYCQFMVILDRRINITKKSNLICSIFIT